MMLIPHPPALPWRTRTGVSRKLSARMELAVAGHGAAGFVKVNSSSLTK
jgi:hypothetical protein